MKMKTARLRESKLLAVFLVIWQNNSTRLFCHKLAGPSFSVVTRSVVTDLFSEMMRLIEVGNGDVTNIMMSRIWRCQQSVNSSSGSGQVCRKIGPINILGTSKKTSFTKTDKTYINILQIGVLWLAKYVEQILACYKSLFQPRFWELQQF